FMLLALILRGVSFEFRGQVDSNRWRSVWEWSLSIGSFLPPLLWGVVLANFMIGMPINEDMNMTGGFTHFLNPFALLGGLLFLFLSMTHGMLFITIRTTAELRERARKAGSRMSPITIVLFLAFIVVCYFGSDVFTYHGQTFMVFPMLAWVALL